MTTPWLRAYTADLMKGCSRIPDESVDVAVFSPPYKRKDGYSRELMLAAGKLLGRVLKPGGMAFMNFGQLREDFDRPFEARQGVIVGSAFTGPALEGWQTYIWLKSAAVPDWRKRILAICEKADGLLGHYQALPILETLLKAIRLCVKEPGDLRQIGHYKPLAQSKTISNYGHEYVFTFHKQGPRHLDRLAMGVPFSDESNLKRGTRGKHGNVHCKGDVWYVRYETTGPTKKKQHAYEYPEPLVEHCLRLAKCQPGDVVLDPFLGSGTTAAVAKRLGLNCYGIELDGARVKHARGRHRRTTVTA